MRPTRPTRRLRISAMMIWLILLVLARTLAPASNGGHPRLLADQAEITRAKAWIAQYPWYRDIFEEHRREIDRFLSHRPVFVSPVKQTYQYKMYTCPKHDTELLYEQFRPFEHRCPDDTTEILTGPKFDAAWAGWYNRLLASHLVWMGMLYQVYDDSRYAEAGREILLGFAQLYLQYPTANTILGPAHVFFGTLSESFWGVDMAYGYDLLYDFPGFSAADRRKIKEQLLYPLAHITQQFPESASNRQLWYNNVSAAVGFLYGDSTLIDFALKGKYGFEWQLGSALPESGFWAEWSGYHFVALRGMIHLAEMARHNGIDLYHATIAGRTMKQMFDAPFDLILPNFEFPRCKDSGGGNILEYATFYEVGYAVYRDRRYLALLNYTGVGRGTQIVGEESGLGRSRAPLTMFTLLPALPFDSSGMYNEQSVNFEGNGFAILRTGSGNDRRYLSLDYGIMGGEHGHPDRLQIGYYARGRNWIVDPLNEMYFNPNLQLWYRQTIAHNTVVIDQTSQTWTNGRGNFFGSLPHLQVASGGSETAYPGVTLTRTVVQTEDYAVDLFDIESAERRIIDWPLHSFGELTIHAVSFHSEPIDRFGLQPGIPGYDQLTSISSGVTDSSWHADFAAEDGEHLGVYAVGEKNTKIFQAMTPPLGGFYKQMVKERNPLPMLISRRVTDTTRFAHLIHPYRGEPTVFAIERTDRRNAYAVHRHSGEDVLFADVENAVYWLLRIHGSTPKGLAGFGIRKIESGPLTLLSSDTPLRRVECRWQDDTLAVDIPDPFIRVKIREPRSVPVLLNGAGSSFRREGEFVVLRQDSIPLLEILSPLDSTLFVGQENEVAIRVWNPTPHPLRGRLSLSLASGWKERVQSQVSWWGGIVNLKAINKGSILHRMFPSNCRIDGGWCDNVTGDSVTVDAGSSRTLRMNMRLPNDIPPALYPALLHFGTQSLPSTIRIVPPVCVTLSFPNARKERLLVEVRNSTPVRARVRTLLMPDWHWRFAGKIDETVTLGASESRRYEVPATLSGYSSQNQLYPIRCRVECDGYVSEFSRDFYVGIAHFAHTTPSLDGTWAGWDTSSPLTIDSSSQVARLLLGNQPWYGRSDLSAKVHVMYDHDYLYIGADVVDDSVVTRWNFPIMSYPWDTDCMEVVLDTRVGSDQGTDPPTPGLFRHLSMAEYRSTEFGPEKWQGGGAGGPLLPRPLLVPGAETFSRRTREGYVMKCRYPLSSLKSVVARPGYKIGFDIAFSDNDGTTYRKNQHIWAGYNQNQSWWDMGTIGAIIFGPER